MEWTEQDMQLLLENLRDAIHVIDENGIFVYANQKYERLVGIPRQSLMGTRVQELVDAGILSSSTAMTALKKRSEYSDIQMFKTNIEVYSDSTPVFDDHGKLTHIVTQSVEAKTLQRLNAMRKTSRNAASRKVPKLSDIQKELNLDGKEHLAVDTKTISIFMMAKRVSSVDAPVLLHGPQGVGKENVARYIHKNSNRAGKPFKHIYANTLADETSSRTLFGYEDDNGIHHSGILDEADGGTVYLDEVIGLPFSIQSKLLSLIHNGTATSMTGKRRNYNIRFIFGSLKDEQAFLADASVNREWYYVLSIFSIYISPLKERKNDIIPLLDNFLAEFNKQYHTQKKFERNVYERLLMYDWPGNHREVKILVNRAVIISKGEYIGTQDLFLDSYMQFSQSEIGGASAQINLKDEIEKIEAEYITQAFNKYKNTRAAAKSLGIDSSTFVRKRQNFIKKGLMQGN
ncbi:MAG: sigma 54-interacting transcriptional regulator [Oscillibacter sp.]|nr:sigma 54-interacting transcriptional regulator [Oscillibacter sp.]